MILPREIATRDYVSFSAIRTFQSCPLKYRFRYVDGLLEEQVSSSLIFGSALHAALECYYTGLLEDGRAPDIVQLLDAYDQSWGDRFDVSVDFGDGEDRETLRRQAERMLLASIDQQLANCLLMRDDQNDSHAEAERLLLRAGATLASLVEEQPKQPSLRTELAMVWGSLAMLASEHGKYGDAITFAERAVSQHEAALANHRGSPNARAFLGVHQGLLGYALAREGRCAEAVDKAAAAIRNAPTKIARIVSRVRVLERSVFVIAEPRMSIVLMRGPFLRSQWRGRHQRRCGRHGSRVRASDRRGERHRFRSRGRRVHSAATSRCGR